MSDGHPHQSAELPDAVDDLVAQLIAEFPELLDAPISSTSVQSLPPSTSTSAPAFVPNQSPNPPLICQWVSGLGVPLVCGATLSPDPKIACTHFRQAHDVRGNEKVTVGCQWRDCQVPPMQRGSLIRHVLSVHLNMLKWQCEFCGKVLSRKGTAHACADSQEAE